MKVELFVIGVFLLFATGIVYSSTSDVVDAKGYYAAECVDFNNKINRYEATNKFYNTYSEPGYVKIRTLTKTVTYPAHMCILYSPN